MFPYMDSDSLRERVVEAVALQLAMELGHTFASFDPPMAAPNTRRIAANALDAALDYLTESRPYLGNDLDVVLAVLREDR